MPEDKLTEADVRALITRANGPLPAAALAAQKTLRDAVAEGQSAFADEGAFSAAKHIVQTFFGA